MVAPCQPRPERAGGGAEGGHDLISQRRADRTDITQRVRASKQIANMQEPRRLNRDDLDERRIIYPESPDRNLVNRFRQLRTQLLEVSKTENFSLVVSGAAQGRAPPSWPSTWPLPFCVRPVQDGAAD